jgi:acyl-CoA synthetase
MRPFLTLHQPALARKFYREALWTEDSFYSLALQHAQQRPDASALRDGSHQWTWAEVVQRADALATQFNAAGLKPGDRVSLWLGNHAAAVVAFIACSRGGYVCNPSLHRSYTNAEVRTLLDRLGSAALITEPGWGVHGAAQVLEAPAPQGSALRAVYADPRSFPRQVPLAELPLRADDPDAVAYMAFTSGTTGPPKCVMHSANTLMANARDMVRDWGLSQDARLLSLSPLSHHIAWVGVSQWLLTGCEFCTDDPPAGVDRLDWIIKTGATYVMGVPTHAVDVLALQRQRGVERLGDVRTFYMAGSPIPPSVAEAFVEQGIKPQNVYGMTENSSHQYTHPDDTDVIATTTCGRGGPAYEIKIFDPANTDVELPVGEAGEIGGRGAALMLGYYANQAATVGSFNRDGWFMSGDLGSIDERGHLTVCGRSKDLIIRGGHNIHPAHIEALALRHPQLDKVAVVPVPDERLGEKVCIVIVGAMAADALLAFLDQQGLSRHDRPEYFLRVDVFPLTASGKVLKRELIADLRAGNLKPELVART